MNTSNNNNVTLWSKVQTGYGHWRITCKVTGTDIYGAEFENAEITTITTNSRAIDGHHGGDQSLVIECLTENDFESDDFDLSEISGGDDDESED